jgi:proline iminopeptidase
LQWSAEFTGSDAMRHADDMATPWFGINQDCYDAIWTELRQTWHESALIPACRALNIPVLIIDGADDLRPRWAVDSLEHALPDVTRRILACVGHVPWLEVPGPFGDLLRELAGLRGTARRGRGHRRWPDDRAVREPRGNTTPC